ncbi:hypothetical protein ACN38_g2035 [Penicillium nordicum]|uniref:Uncharacterized protein n=1 Tax=Penicillium nordicum TaxID=229535 RepID=A0A0M9WJD0_9EURO|nr:hypothetical protein ACN38_g2035 [Penicillium nordicum]
MMPKCVATCWRTLTRKTRSIWVWSCMDLNDVDVSCIGTRVATGPLSHGGYGEMMVERRRLEEEEKRRRRRRRGKKVGGFLLYGHIPGTFLKWKTLQRTFFHSPMSHVIFPICILFL